MLALKLRNSVRLKFSSTVGSSLDKNDNNYVASKITTSGFQCYQTPFVAHVAPQSFCHCEPAGAKDNILLHQRALGSGSGRVAFMPLTNSFWAVLS
eukprot:2469519-Amphidinium_carterae.1